MSLGLVACGGKSESTNVDNNTDVEEDEGSTTDAADSSTGEDQWAKYSEDETLRAPKIDLKNKTLSIVGIDQPQFDLEAEDPVVAKFFKEYYGGEINQIVTAPEEWYSKTASMIMSGEAPDLVSFHPNGFPGVVVQDIVQPVDDIFDIDDPVFQHLKGPWEQISLGGKHYTLPWLSMNAEFVFYNKQMFEDAGLDTPRQYYERGEWDWNTFKELAAELTQDTNGDGETDIYGASFVGWHESLFVDSIGKDLVKTDENGNLVSNLRDPDIARGFNFLIDLINKDKVVNPNLFNYNEMFEAEKTAMVMGPYFWANQWPSIKGANKQEFVPQPKDPNSDEYYQSGSFLGYYVPKGTDNYDTIKAFLYSAVISMREQDVEGTDAYQKTIDTALEQWPNYTLEDAMREKEWTLEYQALPKLIHVGDLITNQTIFNRMYQEQLPFATVIEEEEPILNAKIEEAMSVAE